MIEEGPIKRNDRQNLAVPLRHEISRLRRLQNAPDAKKKADAANRQRRYSKHHAALKRRLISLIEQQNRSAVP